MAGFHGTIRQVYRVQATVLLVLEETYSGDIGPGDWVRVGEAPEAAGGAVARIKDLAWGSAFRAENPPLTLVAERLEGELPPIGSVVVSEE